MALSLHRRTDQASQRMSRRVGRGDGSAWSSGAASPREMYDGESFADNRMILMGGADELIAAATLHALAAGCLRPTLETRSAAISARLRAFNILMTNG